jgi:TfoX/Sxy family transcriptional regulator of competence genes
MGTDKNFVDYVVEQADLGEVLTYRKMFGEYALYHAGKVVALFATTVFSSSPVRPP